MDEKWIVVTGTSSGIGRATALRLAQKGFCVLAGVRKLDDFGGLQDDFQKQSGGHSPGKITPLMIDVASDASIGTAIDAIQTRIGERGLYGLVNNAGIAVPGPVEFVSEADWRRQFEVNFFGPIELTKRCLPLLRQGVKTYGRFKPRLIFVSSVGGRVAQPMASPYTTSKFAVSSLGDSLRLELYGQGIGVTLIEPGSIRTPIWSKGQDEIQQKFPPNHPARQFYDTGLKSLSSGVEKSGRYGSSPQRVAKKLVAALQRRHATGRVLVGVDAKAVSFLRSRLPLSWFDAMLMRLYGLNKRAP